MQNLLNTSGGHITLSLIVAGCKYSSRIKLRLDKLVLFLSLISRQTFVLRSTSQKRIVIAKQSKLKINEMHLLKHKITSKNFIRL